jgi:hypothetical protein
MIPLRLRTFLNGLAASVSMLALHGAGADDGFAPLFNGRDLSGWVNVNCAPETFTVRDGMIHCDGIPTGALRTVRQYENFELELEWRHLKAGGNAGVFIWAGPMPAVGQPFLRAIEVQVLDHGYGKSDWFTTHGDVFPIHGSRMKPFSPSNGDRSFPKEMRSHGAPEWNRYRIVATNGVLRLSVNGAEVSGGTGCTWRKGYIALESEGGQVDWRHLRIRELPSTGAGPADSAPEAEPWRSLYDGRGLRGWTPFPGAEAVWAAEDWTLRSAAKSASSAVLRGPVCSGATRMVFDWKWDAEPASKVPPVSLSVAGREPSALPPMPKARSKDWNRLELRRVDGRLELILNGEPAGEVADPAGDFTPVLVPGPVLTRLASLFVR